VPLDPSNPRFVNREKELSKLRQMLSKQGAVVEVLGPPGIGKTALIFAFADRYLADFPGGVERFSAFPGTQMSDAFNTLADRFRRSTGPALLLIDDAELMDVQDSSRTIRQLGRGSSDIRTLISGREGLGLGERLVLPPLSLREFARMVRLRIGEPANDKLVHELWEQSQGSPRMAWLLLEDWINDPNRSLDQLGDLLRPINVPGLLGPDGRPIRRGSSLERPIIERVKLVSEELIRVVAVRPELLFELKPREFEEFAATLFQKQGFEVTLTQQSRDGRKDLYLAQSNRLGSFRYAVECKRYAPDNPVRVGVVRSLYGVVSRENLTAGIVLTTSHFTKDAIEEARETRYRMSLQDFASLRQALEPFRPRQREW
jgi:restriction system protein